AVPRWRVGLFAPLGLFLDQPAQQRAVAGQRVLARRGTEQRDGLALGDEGSQLGDQLLRSLRLHLVEIATPILVPGDPFFPALAVEVGVQSLARAQLLEPAVPVLVLLRQRPRTVAADQHAQAVVRLDGIVPAPRLDGHQWVPRRTGSFGGRRSRYNGGRFTLP